ncbi:HypC/HybG/HupF family hydrogenase formation chaperone [Rhodoblastus sp.]|jgi:hydrogenase maturation factor|uniref:HypC/HybG/HupF family hydrogenase formation chaperone n=1 Tax=Rhodoblastus sp. TaxID=1962975 RepID=UPI00260509DB|nr:HypC/HybG/HupF family hydrogenase formation chaperone [Rhodoblastus sp.]
MCAPLPFQIVELLPEQMAIAKLGDSVEKITVEEIDDPQVGDFVILHGKVALTKIDPDEALKLLAELGAQAPIAPRSAPTTP